MQALYSVRSERLLIEQLDYNLLFRWFVGLGIDDPVWHPTAFTTNRDRLLEGEVAGRFLAAILAHARVRQLLSREHFSVDGRLIASRRASIKSFRPKDGADDRRRVAAATAAGTSTASGGATTPMPRPPTPRRGCSARARARTPG